MGDRVIHTGPSRDEYQAAHPEVDWETHEVLYRLDHIDPDEAVIYTSISGHWVKPGYGALEAAPADEGRREFLANRRRPNEVADLDGAALLEEIRKVMTLEEVELSSDCHHVTIKIEFFRDLVTARARYWALLDHFGDDHPGVVEALRSPVGDQWAKDITA